MSDALAYLDYNATTPVKAEVVTAMTEALSQVGNASSVHRHGRLAAHMIEDARLQVAQLLNTSPARITFTSGGTEANNLALRGILSKQQITHVFASAIEHDSVLKCVEALDCQVEILLVTADGIVDLAALESALNKVGDENGKALVSVMFVNNETGVIQPISKVIELAHGAGALVHTDAVQALGKIDIDFEALGVDLLSLSAHKFGGPQGVGALALKAGLSLDPILHGGGQESRHRPGTENLPGIVGLGKAAALIEDVASENARLKALRDKLEDSIKDIALDAVIFGKEVDRVGNTSCFALEGMKAETQVMAMDLSGVSVSSGSACSSGKVTSSHVLSAMGADDALADSALRVSFGWASTEEDVDKFIAVWGKFVAQKRGTNDIKTA